MARTFVFLVIIVLLSGCISPGDTEQGDSMQQTTNEDGDEEFIQTGEGRIPIEFIQLGWWHAEKYENFTAGKDYHKVVKRPSNLSFSKGHTAFTYVDGEENLAIGIGQPDEGDYRLINGHRATRNQVAELSGINKLTETHPTDSWVSVQVCNEAMLEQLLALDFVYAVVLDREIYSLSANVPAEHEASGIQCENGLSPIQVSPTVTYPEP